jgi:hypothetical protein
MIGSDLFCAVNPAAAARLADDPSALTAALLAILRGDSFPLLEGSQWPKALALATQHGLFPAVSKRLPAALWEEMPGLGEAVRQTLKRNTCRNLTLLGETVRLLSLLRAAGITAVPFKGGVLGHLAHGNVALRQAGDMDLFVRKSDLKAAIDCLRAAGYRLDAKWNSALREGHFRFDCECEMVHPGKQMCVDLHWEFTARNFSLPLPVEEMFGRLQRVRISGADILSFAPEDLLLILCLHAAKHHWHRLEWVFTMDAFIRRHPALDWAGILQRAGTMHLTRIVATGLRLVRELFDCPLPDPVWKWVEACRHSRGLATDAVAWIRAGVVKPSPMQLRRFHARGREGLWQRVQYWLGAAFTPSEKDYAVELPAGFSWAHYFTRPVRLLMASVAQLFGRASRSPRDSVPAMSPLGPSRNERNAA